MAPHMVSLSCEHLVGNISFWGSYFSLYSSGFSLSIHTRIEDEAVIISRCLRIALCTYGSALETSGCLHLCCLTFLYVLHRQPLASFNQEAAGE